MPEPSNAPAGEPVLPQPPPSTIDHATPPKVHEQPTCAPVEPSADVAEQPTLAPSSTPLEPRVAPSAGESVLEAHAFGDYELLGELARGGMGVVYRARERQSGRLVALKMMLDDCRLDTEQLQRFSLEARATSELNHAGIVAIHAWGESEGRFFYTMDYVPGLPLNRILHRKPLPLAQAVHYLIGIAQAVQAAHAQGIVHRDLKPSNVIIDPTGQPRVLDFGLAKRRSETLVDQDEVLDALPTNVSTPKSGPVLSPGQSPHQTGKGAVLGTPGYMAPEQARGQQNEVGPRADVHALGAILYEMLTGRPPFEAGTVMDTLIQVIEQPAAPVRTLNARVPKSLALICERCLEKDPEYRYVDAGSLAEDLENYWRRYIQRRRFARLMVCVWLVTAMLFGLGRLLPESVAPWSDVFGNRIHAAMEVGGPALQGTADVLRSLFSVVVVLLPFVSLLASLVWSGAWLWSRRWRSDSTRRNAPGSPLRSDPYLQKLFALRGSEGIQPDRQPAAAGLADIELGKTLLESKDCLLRKGLQKSLDRPVLVWIDPRPTQPGAPSPGVIVHHPSILSLHAVASSTQGRFLVTEATAATPLADLLDHRHLEPLEAVFLVIKVASALQAFHDQGVVHGRMGPEWILAQGDLEPRLCPCGVPGQSLGQRTEDVKRLAAMLLKWLPLRPKRWQRQPLTTLYRVCDAAQEGQYTRPRDLGTDLERATYAALVRWRAGLAGWLVFILFAAPMLLVAIAFGIGAFRGDAEGPQATLGAFTREYLLVLVAPSAILLGFVHGRAFSNHLQLRLLHPVRKHLWRETILPAVLRLVAIVCIPATIAYSLVSSAGNPVSPLPLFLASGEMLGFWFLGVCLTGVVAFLEILLGSLQTRAAGRDLDGTGIGQPSSLALPSPQEAARTMGGRTLSRGLAVAAKAPSLREGPGNS